MKGVGTIFFISKKDTFYSVLIWGGVVLVFLPISFHSVFNMSIANFILLVFGLMITGWIIWIWFSTGYRIKNHTLKIEGGPLTQTVDIMEIKKITKEKSLVTAAALSIDRVLIHYGNNKFASISPKEEREFIKLLLSKNPHIQIGDDLSELYKI